jgi:2-deoxy-D-gluconate 3-dehydrogenase
VKLFDLTGRVAIVTGGNGGIGLGIAAGLAEAGASLVLAGRNITKGAAAVEQIELFGAQAIFVEADLSTEDACTSLIDRTLERFGRLDILVNNAGIHIPAPAARMPLADWARELDVNLTGPFLCSRAAHSSLAKQGGKVINIGSLASQAGMIHGANYCASKGGLVQLTRALALEWAPDGIQVNAILPGWISTDITAPAQQGVPGFDEMIVRRTPAKRWGQPKDLAGIAVFLASPASDFITGTATAVDGGFSIALF